LGVALLRGFGRLKLVKRQHFAVVMAGALGAAVAFGMSVREQPEYSASAEVAVNQQDLPPGVLRGGSPATVQQLQRQVETLSSIAASPIVAKDIPRLVPDLHWSTDVVLDHSSVEPSSNADVLVFHVRAPSAALASRFATAYAQAFTDFRNDQTTHAIDGVLRDVEKNVSEAGRLAAQDRRNGGQPTAEHRQQLTALLSQKADLQALSSSAVHSTTVLRPGNDARQTAPRVVRTVILGLALGLIFGFGATVAMDRALRRVSKPAEIDDLLRLPMLARVGKAPSDYSKRTAVISLREPDHPHTEGYRMAMAALQVALARTGARSIGISSATQGDGKSTLIANLAVCFAGAGQSVALVDLDLRRSAIAAMFAQTCEGPGVGEVLRGDVAPSACLLSVPLGDQLGDAGGRLDILCPRTGEPAPYRSVTQASVARLLEEMTATHDIVLVDTPPLLAVSDGALAASSVDALLLTVRVGSTARAAVADLAQMLETLAPPVLGYVLVGADSGHSYPGGYGAPVVWPLAHHGSRHGHHDDWRQPTETGPLVPAKLDP
jgi:capsular exopolysaccharide synthesis family protein